MTDLEIIEECLKEINPSILDYDEWLQIGSAIKHHGGDVSLWDNWSSFDNRYKNRDCINRWNNLDKGLNTVTVGTVIKLCRDNGGIPPINQSYNGEDSFEAIPLNESISVPITTKIIKKEWLEVEQLPKPSDNKQTEELIEYLSTLFSSDEYVGYVTCSREVTGKDGSKSYVPSDGGIHDKTAGELIESLKKHKDDLGFTVGDWTEECGAWIRFNPLDGEGVTDKNITDYRYALVESDTINTAEQYSILKNLELPIAAMVHSGGKSIHAIVRIEASSYKEYQKRVDFLYDICKKNGLIIDRKNRNPSRLSRMPGVTRNGNKQYLIATNIGQSSYQEWVDYLGAIEDNLPEITSLSEVMDNLPPLQEVLIENILRVGHKMLIAGPSKAGKSFLLLQLVIAIAEGREWLGLKCKQGKVLYINLELDNASCLHRLKDMYSTLNVKGATFENIDIWNLRGNSLPLTELAPKLIRRSLKKKYTAIIIDPIYKIITGDENSADQMAKFCNYFDKIATELQCATIYCHHHSKGNQGQKRAFDRASGSGVFARDPDALIDLVEVTIDEDRRRQISYSFRLEKLRSELFSRDKNWDEAMGYEDSMDVDKVVDYFRENYPDEAQPIINAEIQQVNAMTGWRINSILREFPSLKPLHAFFRYPIHVLNKTLLEDAPIVGDVVYKPRGRAKAQAKAKAENTNDLSLETIGAFELLQKDGKTTIKEMATHLGVTERTIRRRAKDCKLVYINGELRKEQEL